jgi:hypothetical protein
VNKLRIEISRSCFRPGWRGGGRGADRVAVGGPARRAVVLADGAAADELDRHVLQPPPPPPGPPRGPTLSFMRYNRCGAHGSLTITALPILLHLLCSVSITVSPAIRPPAVPHPAVPPKSFAPARSAQRLCTKVSFYKLC